MKASIFILCLLLEAAAFSQFALVNPPLQKRVIAWSIADPKDPFLKFERVNIWSTTNVIYTKDDLYYALTLAVRFYGTEMIPTNGNYVLRLENFIPPTQDRLLPLNKANWQLWGSGWITNRQFSFVPTNQWRFFAVTVSNVANHAESGFSLISTK